MTLHKKLSLLYLIAAIVFALMAYKAHGGAVLAAAAFSAVHLFGSAWFFGGRS